jgi:hypothetical protein
MFPSMPGKSIETGSDVNLRLWTPLQAIPYLVSQPFTLKSVIPDPQRGKSPSRQSVTADIISSFGEFASEEGAEVYSEI